MIAPNEPVDPDVIRRLESVCRTLESSNATGIPVGFHQLAHDIRVVLAAASPTPESHHG